MRQSNIRKWLRRIGLPIVALTVVVSIASSHSYTALADSTSKQLSTNFTLVGFSGFPITFTVEFIKDDGSEWRPDEEGTLTATAPQAILRQYDDAQLTGGRGSVRVNSSGEVGAVVQIQARNGQVPTSGAYNGASAGSEQAVIPLVSRRGNSASGGTNSQITIQNTGSSNTSVAIDFYDLAGTKLPFVKSGITLSSGQATEVDLDNEGSLPVPYFGSAVVRSTDGGQVAVVSNFFTGPDAMQTYEGFAANAASAASTGAVAQGATSWGVPLFTSALPNTLNTPVTVQNISGATIPAGGVSLECTPSPGFTGSFTKTNPDPIPDRVSYAFNPVVDDTIPDNWVGSCVVSSGSSLTVAFVQLRFVAQGRAASHQALPLDQSAAATHINIPLYARRLPNSFATAVTIINQSDQPNNVQLVYTAGADAPAGKTCSANFAVTIPANGNHIENHRVPNGIQDAVEEIDETCFGSLSVTSTSNLPIAGFVQLDFLSQSGDPYMAHNAFPVE